MLFLILTRTSGLRYGAESSSFSSSSVSAASVVSSPTPRMAEMSGVMRTSETTRMSLAVPDDGGGGAGLRDAERRRRWKKVSMSPAVGKGE